jgi:hypothetical protein
MGFLGILTFSGWELSSKKKLSTPTSILLLFQKNSISPFPPLK